MIDGVVGEEVYVNQGGREEKKRGGLWCRKQGANVPRDQAFICVELVVGRPGEREEDRKTGRKR